MLPYRLNFLLWISIKGELKRAVVGLAFVLCTALLAIGILIPVLASQPLWIK